MPESEPKERPPEPTRPAKKKWEPPRIVESGKLFEMNSLACGKNSPATLQCQQNPTSS
jgi:hypothetical protein